MAKKKSAVGGAADRKRRGLKAVLVGVRPDVHAAMGHAAVRAGLPVTRWLAGVAEAAARKALAEARIPWPEKIPENSSHSI